MPYTYSGHKPWNHLLLLLSHFTSELSVNVPGSEYKVLSLLLPATLLTQAITICNLDYWNTHSSSLCLWFCSAFRLYPIKYVILYHFDRLSSGFPFRNQWPQIICLLPTSLKSSPTKLSLTHSPPSSWPPGNFLNTPMSRPQGLCTWISVWNAFPLVFPWLALSCLYFQKPLLTKAFPHNPSQKSPFLLPSQYFLSLATLFFST